MEYVRIFSDENFEKHLERLNVLNNSYSRWAVTQARKDHIDEFGIQISMGEIYYKRKYGAAYSDIFKLSRESMEKLLFSLFNGNLGLQELADKLVTAEHEARRNIISRLL